MNKTAAMVVLAAILISGLVIVSAIGRPVYAQSGKEMKVEIVSGATNKAAKAYAPNPLKVKAGTTVVWKNVDSAIHTVVSGKSAKDAASGKMFESKTIGPKKEFKFTFTKEGTYDYYCSLHPAMVGKVVVGKASAAKGPTVEIVSGATNKADKSYAPNPVKAKAGQTVVWKNVDSAVHTVTSGKSAKDAASGKMFDSKTMGPKKEFSFKFDKKGTYDYYCLLHPTMVGKVVVS